MSNVKKVICLDTNEVFDSAVQASLAYGYPKTALTSALKNGYNFCGMHWEYYDVYLENKDTNPQALQPRPLKRVGGFLHHKHSEQTKKLISENLKTRKRKGRKVINIDTGETFDNCSDACRKYQWGTTYLASVLKKANDAGEQIAIVGGYHWKYVE